MNDDAIVKLLDKAVARITELKAALAERDATIAAAPHADTCSFDWKGPCDCWKSAAPGDARATHDAEIKAQALDDAADEFQNFGVITGDNTPGYFYVRDIETEPHDWLRDRAKAIREEGRSHD